MRASYQAFGGTLSRNYGLGTPASAGGRYRFWSLVKHARSILFSPDSLRQYRAP